MSKIKVKIEGSCSAQVFNRRPMRVGAFFLFTRLQTLDYIILGKKKILGGGRHKGVSCLIMFVSKNTTIKSEIEII